MIERKFVSRNLKTYLVNECLSKNLKRVGFSKAKVQRTPLGEKVVIFASRPGLIVGKKGSNIKKLTLDLKKEFGLENPQIEISEIEDINLDAQVVAERICNYLERFGATRFKSIGHRVIGDVMGAGALGIEIIISGRIPGARAKSWRFYQGYLKKCGDIAVSGVRKAQSTANLKIGAVGIKVSIMPKELKEKYNIELIPEKEEIIEEIKPKEPSDSIKEEKETEKKVEETKPKKNSTEKEGKNLTKKKTKELKPKKEKNIPEKKEGKKK